MVPDLMRILQAKWVNFVMMCALFAFSFVMSPLNFDLHCHSRVSDGVLEPALLLERAAAQKVDVLALTDHDDVAGLDEAHQHAQRLGIRFIDGVEISVSWQSQTLHIVGLNVDRQDTSLLAGLAGIREGRKERAAKIAVQLSRVGIRDALAGAWQQAGNTELIGRMHFARYLVAQGICPDVQAVFNRYLAKGKPGYVSHQWADFRDAIGWIRVSGGRAVLAHPGRYPMSTGKMRTLLTEFSDAGGEAIEVVTSNHTPEQRSHFAVLARQFNLMASRGSDFHSPEEHWRDLGRLPPLPESCLPVWHDWNLDGNLS